MKMFIISLDYLPPFIYFSLHFRSFLTFSSFSHEFICWGVTRKLFHEKIIRRTVRLRTEKIKPSSVCGVKSGWNFPTWLNRSGPVIPPRFLLGRKLNRGWLGFCVKLGHRAQQSHRKFLYIGVHLFSCRGLEGKYAEDESSMKLKPFVLFAEYLKMRCMQVILIYESSFWLKRRPECPFIDCRYV